MAVLAAALALAGCGGGGGGGGALSAGPSGPAAPGAPRHSSPGTQSEYLNAWGLAAIDAAAAYRRIELRDGHGKAPGAGARVAAIDDGIDTGHWEFESRIVTEVDAADPGDAPDREHGTAVASVIAAKRGQGLPGHIPASERPAFRGADFHGVAWGIDSLEMVAISLGTGDPDTDYEGIAVDRVDDAVEWLANDFSALTTAPDFVNMSFGVEGLIENYVGETFGAKYAPAIAVLAQGSRTSGKAVLVVAAGNAHGSKCSSPEPNCAGGGIDATSPQLYAGLPVLERSLRSHLVAVVATTEAGGIASFSNRCGLAAKWCIAAPGQGIRAAFYEKDETSGTVERGYGKWSGTSLAAPFVTGGLAVLKHWFRSRLSNEQLLARLYATARVTPDAVAAGGMCPEHLDTDGDRSDCELSSVFGRGRMDLGAATAPVGAVSFALAGGPPAGGSHVAPGRATGDGMRLSLAGQEIALFDTLGAPFWTDAARFVAAPASNGLAARVSNWLDEGGREDAAPAGARLQFGFGGSGKGHLGIASTPVTADARFGDAVLSAFASTGASSGDGVRALEGGAHGLGLAWRPAGAPAALRAGWIREPEALFGSGAAGAFGRLSSNLGFVGASHSFETGGWRFDMEAEAGRAAPEASGGMLAGGGEALSSSFRASAARAIADGTLRLSLSQPLRVESGSLALSLPVGRTPEGAVERRRIPVSLAPSGRQIDFGIDWTAEIAPDAVWRAGAVVSRHPGHDGGRGPELTLLVGLRAGL